MHWSGHRSGGNHDEARRLELLAWTFRSDLLDRAARERLYRLRCERDAERHALHPLSTAETTPWPNETWRNETWPDDDIDWEDVFDQ